MESVIPTPKKVKVLNPGDEIQGEVRRLAQEIRRDYQGKNPLLIGILKGSFVFLADHIRLLEIPAEVDFARLSSYGAAQTSSGTVRMGHSVQATLAGRDVLIIDDIEIGRAHV